MEKVKQSVAQIVKDCDAFLEHTFDGDARIKVEAARAKLKRIEDTLGTDKFNMDETVESLRYCLGVFRVSFVTAYTSVETLVAEIKEYLNTTV